MSASPADVAEMLDQLERALGPTRLLARCGTDVLETVYVERQDGGVVVHDGGETCFYIIGHPATYAPWSDDMVERHSAEHDVSVVREQEEGRPISLRLEHQLSATDDPKDVVRVMSDLLDVVFSGHLLDGKGRADISE
ncbi:MAG: hypothetical protein M3N98_13985 [Actinomycetota bacterium]|nr:hypothetical protein [Actinomycetota bacterium]